jgi:hypothetical protein
MRILHTSPYLALTFFYNRAITFQLVTAEEQPPHFQTILASGEKS